MGYDLNGTIPSEIVRLSSLIYLNLAENQLREKFFLELGSLTSLVSLGLRDNNLKGNLTLIFCRQSWPTTWDFLAANCGGNEIDCSCCDSGKCGNRSDGEPCSTSDQCNNGCCSYKYSDDRKLKCTPLVEDVQSDICVLVFLRGLRPVTMVVLAMEFVRMAPAARNIIGVEQD